MAKRFRWLTNVRFPSVARGDRPRFIGSRLDFHVSSRGDTLETKLESSPVPRGGLVSSVSVDFPAESPLSGRLYRGSDTNALKTLRRDFSADEDRSSWGRLINKNIRLWSLKDWRAELINLLILLFISMNFQKRRFNVVHSANLLLVSTLCYHSPPFLLNRLIKVNEWR